MFVIASLELGDEDRGVDSADRIRVSGIPVSRLDAACRSHAAFLKELVEGSSGQCSRRSCSSHGVPLKRRRSVV